MEDIAGFLWDGIKMFVGFLWDNIWFLVMIFASIAIIWFMIVSVVPFLLREIRKNRFCIAGITALNNGQNLDEKSIKALYIAAKSYLRLKNDRVEYDKEEYLIWVKSLMLYIHKENIKEEKVKKTLNNIKELLSKLENGIKNSSLQEINSIMKELLSKQENRKNNLTKLKNIFECLDGYSKTKELIEKAIKNSNEQNLEGLIFAFQKYNLTKLKNVSLCLDGYSKTKELTEKAIKNSNEQILIDLVFTFQCELIGDGCFLKDDKKDVDKKENGEKNENSNAS